MLFRALPSCLLIGFQPTLLYAYNLTWYDSRYCSGMSLPGDDQTLHNITDPYTKPWTCKRIISGGPGLLIKQESDTEDGYMLMAFGSRDCNPDTLLYRGVGGCLTNAEEKDGPIQSIEIWDLMDDSYEDDIDDDEE